MYYCISFYVILGTDPGELCMLDRQALYQQLHSIPAQHPFKATQWCLIVKHNLCLIYELVILLFCFDFVCGVCVFCVYTNVC